MRLCSCGFANADDAVACTACGATLGAGAPALFLEDLRSGTVVAVTPPGGVLGRAGDFEPDLFSPRVSGVHAVAVVSAEGRWTIEHVGRNESSVERAGVWSVLRTGAPQPLFGGETLKLADMVFRVRVEEAASRGVPCESGTPCPASCPTAPAANAEGAEGGEQGATWSVRCPVCGTEHEVAGPDERVAACTFCSDPFDRQQIARVAARPIARP